MHFAIDIVNCFTIIPPVTDYCQPFQHKILITFACTLWQLQVAPYS